MSQASPEVDAVPAWRAVVNSRTFARLVSFPIAMFSGTILAIAIWLDPAPTGHGTHLQLGLSPCSFLTLTGLPCPMCGATTSFALMAALHPLHAVINQPFASLLFLMNAGALGISASEVIDPNRRWQRVAERIAPWESQVAIGFLVLMGASWVWKIWMMSGGNHGV